MQDRIRVAANALVVKDGNALLVEFSGGTDQQHYNFPGGGVELGETLEQAVRREVMEETCLDVRVERLLLIVESIGSRNTNFIGGEHVPWNEVRFFFLCHPMQGSNAGMPDMPDNDHQTAVRWFSIATLTALEVLPQVSSELVEGLNDPTAHPRIVPNPHPWPGTVDSNES